MAAPTGVISATGIDAEASTTVNGEYTEVPELLSWALSRSAEVTAWGSSDSGGYKKRKGGTKDGTVTLECKMVPASMLSALGIVEGGEVFLKLYLDDTAFYHVSVVIESVDVNTNADTGEPVSISISAGFNGAPIAEPLWA